MRTKNSFKNFSGIVVGSAISLLLSLWATPILLRALGVETYGVYRVVFDTIGYLVILELGLADSILPLITKAANQSKSELGNVLRAALRSFLKVIPLKIVTTAFIYFILIYYLLPLDQSWRPQIFWACVLGMIGSFFCVLVPFKQLVEAKQKAYRLQILLSSQAILIILASILFAKNGLGLIGQFAALLIGAIPYNFYLLWVGWQELKNHPKSDFQAQDQHLLKINKDSRTLFISSICSRLSLMSDTIIVGYFLGPSIVTGFYLTQRLTVLAQPYLNGIGNASWASLAELYWQNKKEEFEVSFRRLMRVNIAFGIFLLIPIVFLNQHFITLWVGPQKFMGLPLTICTAFNVLGLSLISLWSWNFNMAGFSPKLVPQYIAFTLVNFISSVLATKFLGPLGPALGTSISILLVSGWIIPLYLEKLFGFSAKIIFKILVHAGLVSIPFMAFCYFLSERWQAQNFFELVIQAIIMCGSGVVYVALAFLTKEDRQYIIGFFKKHGMFKKIG